MGGKDSKLAFISYEDAIKRGNAALISVVKKIKSLSVAV